MEETKELKAIKLNKKNSIIEGNLVELPLVNYSRANKDLKVINYPWKDAKGKAYDLEIRGSVKHGLPKDFDFDVLLALIRLFAKQKELTYSNCLIKSDKQITAEEATVYFSLNELSKELNKSAGGDNLKRLQKAIEILKDTSIHGQFYDKYKGKHVARIKKGFSVIDDYQIYTIEDEEMEGETGGKGWRAVKAYTYVRFNRFFVRSIHNTYFKYYDYDKYLELGKNGIAKRLYLVLCKWRNNKSSLKIGYDKLYEKIPLDPEKPKKHNNRLVKNACEKLIEKNVIYSYAFEKENLAIQFTSPVKEEKRIASLLERYNNFAEINTWFLAQGFTQEEFLSYMNVIMYQVEYVKALLRYVDEQKETVAINDFKKYIDKGMHLPYYEIDKKYYNSPTEKE